MDKEKAIKIFLNEFEEITDCFYNLFTCPNIKTADKYFNVLLEIKHLIEKENKNV